MIKLNGYKIEPTVFPDGTQQVWQIPEDFLKGEITVEWWWENDAEIITLLQLDLLLPKLNYRLIVPYLPYARQDKEVSNTSCFGLAVLLDLLSMRVGNLVVFDPHNIKPLTDVFGDECSVVMPNIDKIADKYDYVCFPDKGAAARYTTTKPVIVGNKVRDQQTGRILKYEVEGLENVPPLSSILVVDDICDGGATFKNLGEVLSDRHIPTLYVSHGLFSKGKEEVDELLQYYTKIVTTNSLLRNSLTKEGYNGVTYISWKHHSVVGKHVQTTTEK